MGHQSIKVSYLLVLAGKKNISWMDLLYGLYVVLVTHTIELSSDLSVTSLLHLNTDLEPFVLFTYSINKMTYLGRSKWCVSVLHTFNNLVYKKGVFYVVVACIVCLLSAFYSRFYLDCYLCCSALAHSK